MVYTRPFGDRIPQRRAVESVGRKYSPVPASIVPQPIQTFVFRSNYPGSSSVQIDRNAYTWEVELSKRFGDQIRLSISYVTRQLRVYSPLLLTEKSDEKNQYCMRVVSGSGVCCLWAVKKNDVRTTDRKFPGQVSAAPQTAFETKYPERYDLMRRWTVKGDIRMLTSRFRRPLPNPLRSKVRAGRLVPPRKRAIWDMTATKSPITSDRPEPVQEGLPCETVYRRDAPL